MRRTSERGAGALSNILMLLILAAAGYVAWSAGPVYFTNYMLKDEMQQACLQWGNERGNEQARAILAKKVQELGLSDYLNAASFTISLDEMTRTRTISCYYEREVVFLPGVVRLVRFDNTVSYRAGGY
jgi:hypothetical protein